MHLDVSADIELLINKRLSTGSYTNVEEVLRKALEAQDAEDRWCAEDSQLLSAHVEEGYQQAERGELLDGAAARLEIQAMKEKWRAAGR